MNVLIVDDQPDVVSGILSGVNWKELKIQETFGAASSAEAKSILNAHKVDILLCDIEMPAESGLELFGWVRSHYEKIRCVFLTAHADFQYAHRALQLGADDYLLQPASYASIEATLSRVVASIRREQIVETYCALGQDAAKEEARFCRGLLWEFSQGIQTSARLVAEKIGAFGFPVRLDSSCRCMLMEILRRQEDCEPWEADLLLYALENVLSELLENDVQRVCALQLREEVYLILLFARPGAPAGVPEEDLARFCELCRNFFKMDAALYPGDPGAFSEIPAALALLERRMQDNVTGLPGVHFNNPLTPRFEYAPDFSLWKNLLAQEGGCGAVRTQIHDYLNDLANRGFLNRELLLKFHEDFLQMFFDVITPYQTRAHEVFAETYDYDAMVRAGSSLSNLLGFVDFAIQYIEEKQNPAAHERSQMDHILAYIQKNIEKNIGRMEIARAVYLTPEYLSRLFKKEMGVGLTEYLVAQRLKIAEALIANTSLSISIIASKVGYVNFSHFARTFKKVYGVSPSEYRQQYRTSDE